MEVTFYADNPEYYEHLNGKNVVVNGDEITIVVKQKTEEEKVEQIIQKLYEFCRNRENCSDCCYLTKGGGCLVNVPSSWELDL